MKRTRRSATTLVETIAATVVAATILVPLVGMMRSGALLDQRCRVRDRAVAHAEGIVDKIRIATVTPAVFNSATYGTLPAGVSGNQLVTVAPGERVRFMTTVSGLDAYRDMILVYVYGIHEVSGTTRLPPVLVVTAIAKPW